MQQEYQERVNALFMQELGHTAPHFTWNTSAEAEEHIKNIGHLQQRLRRLKRELRSQSAGIRRHASAGGSDSLARDIDGVIMQLAMAKLYIGKNRHEANG